MIRRTVSTLCLAALASIGLAAFGEPPRPADEEVTLHVSLPEWPQASVRVAVNGALRRLAAPRCASVLSEFQDTHGTPLDARLEASRLTLRQYLASVRWVDGSDHQRCHVDSITVAFTQPGSRVVYICSDRFTQTFPRESEAADIAVIHEFLHALGLGENPPSPGDISRTVHERCGDRR